MAQQRQPPPPPKPFIWLPLPQQAPRKHSPTGLEVFRERTGRLDVSFVVESAYLYVGSGGYDFKPNAKQTEPDVWYTFYRRAGQLCVPGTSLKGAIRSIVEAISNSCVSQSGSNEYLRPTHTRCPVNDNQVCISCSLFGRTGWRGRVHFADATPAQKIETKVVKISDLWPPRNTQGRKFYAGGQFQSLGNLTPEGNHRFVEGVVKGSRLNTSIYFENVTSEELGLVFCALGWDVDAQGQLVNAFYPRVGGAKPRCFGIVRFTAPIVTLWGLQKSQLQLTREKKTGKDALAFVAECIAQCKKSSYFMADAWQLLLEGFKKPDPCPQELY